jgi:hypothetical protein
MEVTHMRRAHTTGLLVGTWLTLLVLLAGCPGGITIPLPPSIFSPSVTTPAGNLVQNQAANVTISAVVVGNGGIVTGVTADLTALGGSATEPLTLSNIANTWSRTVTLTPTVVGTREIVITARSSSGLSSEATATITVTGTGGGGDGNNAPPVVSTPTITGTLTATFASTIFLTVVATDPDGTVQSVVADLSPIGGLSAQPLFESVQTPTFWTFTGVVTPPTFGTLTVLVQATDDLGASTTVSAPVTVNFVSP